MKKGLILSVAFLFMLTLTVTAWALDLEVGPEVEITLNKEIHLDNMDSDADLAVQYYDVKATIGIGDWLKVSPKAGINHMSAVVDSPMGDIEFNSGIGWNVGVDADAKVLATKYADVHLIGSYQFSRTDIDEIDIGGVTIDNPLEMIVYLHEFEFGGILSKDLREIDALRNMNISIPVVPYIGMVYSNMIGNADVNLSVVDLDEDISAKNNIGLRCGLRAEPLPNWEVSVDAKLVDETSIIAKASYKF